MLKDGENGRDGQSLTSADKDSFHGSEVSDAEASTLANGESKLGDEDCAEKADAHCEYDSRGAFQPPDVLE